MTWVDVHAITLLVLPIATIVLLVLSRRRRPRAADALIATVISFFISFASMSCKHLCREGDPYAQWAIPVLCLWGILLFVADKRVRRSAAITMFLTMLGLCEQFHYWAHQQDWTGSPGGSRITEGNVNNSKIKNAEMCLAMDAESDPTDYSACWLSDLPPIQATKSNERIDFYCMGPADYTRCWHTWLTGLYRAQGGERDFWYLGGPLKDAAGRIVVKDRS